MTSILFHNSLHFHSFPTSNKAIVSFILLSQVYHTTEVNIKRFYYNIYLEDCLHAICQTSTLCTTIGDPFFSPNFIRFIKNISSIIIGEPLSLLKKIVPIHNKKKQKNIANNFCSFIFNFKSSAHTNTIFENYFCTHNPKLSYQNNVFIRWSVLIGCYF